jgi:hypothetical protein
MFLFIAVLNTCAVSTVAAVADKEKISDINRIKYFIKLNGLSGLKYDVFKMFQIIINVKFMVE